MEGKDYQTLAGFVVKHLGRGPKEGETFESQGHVFEILDNGQTSRGQSACHARGRQSKTTGRLKSSANLVTSESLDGRH